MGSKLLYYLILIPISHLPFWALYLISNFLYIVLYKLVAYRTKVVRQNLSSAFPDKDEIEIKEIEEKFYRHLCDLIVEGIKAFTITQEETEKRMVHRNIEVMNQYKSSKRTAVLVGGHYGNWELYAIGIGLVSTYSPIAIFTPLSNKFLNKKITKSRSKYGLGLLPTSEVRAHIQSTSDEQSVIIFAADQSPRKSQKAYWMNFLNQETGIQFGTEKFAKSFNAVVIFGNIYKVKRGHYEVEYEVICENAEETEYGYITQAHTKKLENIIKKQPEYWLWSHKRWKHKRPVEAAFYSDMRFKL